MSAARILTAVCAILAVSSCYIMQPGGSNTPAKHRADPKLLREQVRTLTEDFSPRYYDQPENLAKCRAFIARAFEQCGARTEEQVYQIDRREFRNVRAFFGDPGQPRIVVGAHYDACEETTANVNPGADDNASGVAGLLGLARLLQQERPTGTTVELVAYCTEEPPYYGSEDMGSYRHAELLHKEGVVVKGALILEMIGYFSDQPGSQRYPLPVFKLFYPSRGNFISLVGGVPDRKLIATTKGAMQGSAPLSVYSTCVPRSMSSIHLSDHRNYWRFGYPALMVTDTAFFRNRNYHQAADTWQTLDYTRMAHVVTQVHQAVLKLGGN
jgi:Peptidase family M28